MRASAGSVLLLSLVAGVDWDVVQALSDQASEVKLYKASFPRNSSQILSIFTKSFDTPESPCHYCGTIECVVDMDGLTMVF